MRFLSALLLLFANAAQSAMTEKPVTYTIEGQAYRGYLQYDDSVHSKQLRPVVLLVPNWLGATEANRRQAAEIAGKDYIVFVADMYGADRQPADNDAAGKAVRALYGDRAELRKRILAAKTAALGATGRLADTRRVAAIGFCFGGATVLELARTGDELAAVVSFHGNLALDAPVPEDHRGQPIRTRILALHGDADPFVPAEQVAAFETEMRAANADWQLVRYGGAVHSFTDPLADWPGKAEYNAKVARRAFAHMREFLAESFR